MKKIIGKPFKKGHIPHNKGKTKENYEPQKRNSEKRKRKDIELKKEYIIDLYLNKSKSQTCIAKLLGCDFTVINRILKEKNIILRPQKYYLKGKPSSMKGKIHSLETIKKIKEARARQVITKKTKRKMSESLIKRYKYTDLKEKVKEARAKQIFPTKDTKIEVKIQNFLKLLHIEFVTHYYISEITNAYQCDILIPSTKTIIECDGCYWHGCKICDKNKSINNFQEKQIEEDKLRTQELKDKGFKVIRLWEHEIKKMKLNDLKERLN